MVDVLTDELIDKSISETRKGKVLDLRRGGLRSIEKLAPRPDVEEIDVSLNKLVSLAGMEVVGRGVSRLAAFHNELENLEGLEGFRRLERLFLQNNRLVSLSNLPVMRSLKWLRIGANPLPEPALSRLVEAVPQLERLDASDLGPLSSLGMFSGLRRLVYLSVAGTGLQSLGRTSGVAGIGTGKLEELDVSRTMVVDFSGLVAQKCLRVLRLVLTPLSKSTLETFPVLPALQELDVSECGIGSTELSMLVRRCPELVSLAVSGNRALRGADFAEILRPLKRLETLWVGDGEDQTGSFVGKVDRLFEVCPRLWQLNGESRRSPPLPVDVDQGMGTHVDVQAAQIGQDALESADLVSDLADLPPDVAAILRGFRDGGTNPSKPAATERALAALRLGTGVVPGGDFRNAVVDDDETNNEDLEDLEEVDDVETEGPPLREVESPTTMLRKADMLRRDLEAKRGEIAQLTKKSKRKTEKSDSKDEEEDDEILFGGGGLSSSPSSPPKKHILEEEDGPLLSQFRRGIHGDLDDSDDNDSHNQSQEDDADNKYLAVARGVLLEQRPTTAPLPTRVPVPTPTTKSPKPPSSPTISSAVSPSGRPRSARGRIGVLESALAYARSVEGAFDSNADEPTSNAPYISNPTTTEPPPTKQPILRKSLKPKRPGSARRRTEKSSLFEWKAPTAPPTSTPSSRASLKRLQKSIRKEDTERERANRHVETQLSQAKKPPASSSTSDPPPSPVLVVRPPSAASNTKPDKQTTKPLSSFRLPSRARKAIAKAEESGTSILDF